MDRILGDLLWRCCGLSYHGGAYERAALVYVAVAVVAAAVLMVVTRR